MSQNNMYEPPIKVDYYCHRTTGMESKTLEVKTEFEDFCKEEIEDARSIAWAMGLTVTEQQTHMSLFLQFEGHETLKSKLFLLK